MPDTDRIERDVLLPAPRSRVWAAIADSDAFGTWFKCRFDRAFEEGTAVGGTLLEPGMEGIEFVVLIERVEPQSHLSFRWHPGGADVSGDYSDEPTTLVTFDLEDAADGTLLRIVESGFDSLPGDPAGEARERNAQGWAIQAERVAAYVAPAD